MSWRSATAWILVAILLGLVPLAYASPPDQTWLAGFYDNADYDDVVVFATSAAAAVEHAPLLPVQPECAISSLGLRRTPDPHRAPPGATYQFRAPPLA
jgi:hypothetical protein